MLLKPRVTKVLGSEEISVTAFLAAELSIGSHHSPPYDIEVDE